MNVQFFLLCYQSDSKSKDVLEKAKNPEDALRLWNLSEKLVGLNT